MPHQKLKRRRPDASRVVAYETLRAVTADDAYANLELGRRLAAPNLDGRDAAFITELVSGTCRALGTYDRIVESASGRALSSLTPEVVDVLRLGAHQLLAMRVPSRAAVAATVELAGAAIGEKVVGLVNAVLRRVSEKSLDEWVALLSTSEDAVGALALRTQHPRWIVEEYQRLLGDEAEQALDANNVAPVPTLVVRPGLSTVDELDGDPTTWSVFGARRAGNPHDVEAIRQGRAGVQDEGSQLVAAAFASTAGTRTSKPWLDLCAGPGGKSALLAGLAAAGGVHLVANEVQPHRAELVAQALRAYPDDRRPTVLCADGTQPAWRAGSFSAVLADVPCTGLGALRRRPESRWRRQASDVDALVPLQRRLLATAIASSEPGGVVAYVTCSPHRAETLEVVRSALTVDVELLDAPAHLPDAMPDVALPADPRLVQLWPHRHGTDAMFMALLRVIR